MTLALLALLQATLGVWTLLLAVPIELGLAHQAGAIAVFATASIISGTPSTRRRPLPQSHAAASA